MASTGVLSSAVQNDGCIIEATTTERTVVLDDSREWSISHSGLAADNSTAASGKIWFAVGTDVTTAVIPSLASNPLTAASNLWYLESGKSMVLRAGIRFLHFMTVAGSPAMDFLPSGMVHGYAKAQYP